MTIFEHSTPTFLIWFATVAALVGAALSLWFHMPRKRVNAAIGALYAAFILLLMWCMFLPGRRDVEVESLKPRFIIALDTSRSMLTTPAEGTPQRWEKALEALDMQWVNSVAAECVIERFTFDTSLSKRLNPEELSQALPEGESTMLRDCLQELTRRYAGMNVAGAVLLSDGVETREATDDWALEARPFPIHTVRLEPDVEWSVDPDLHIDSANTPRRTTVGWKTELTAVISGQGSGGTPVNVQLFKDGMLHQEKPTQLPDSGGARETKFELEHPEIGLFNYRVHIPPLLGESNTNDNDFAISVRVADAKNRLLYVEGPPRWEYKFLRRALIANSQITPIVFYSGFDGKPYGGVPVGNMTSDMTEAELALLKVVVIGNLDAKTLTEARAQNLVAFVEAGGSLVLLGGTEAWGKEGLSRTALRATMPLRKHSTKPTQGDKPFPIHIADAGMAHPAFAGDSDYWATVPPVLSFFPRAQLSAGAQTLVEVEAPTGRHPIVISHRYGDGKVVVILTDSLWKWQLTAHASESKPYQRFWDQLIDWLLPSEEELTTQDVELFANRDGLFLGETIELSARLHEDMADEGARVQCLLVLPDKREVPYAMAAQPVTTPTGKTYPGYVVPFTADTPGLYTATAIAGEGDSTVKSDPLSFFVKPFTPESMPRPINTTVLKTIAQSSEGRFFENLSSLNRAMEVLQTSAIEEETVAYKSLWQTWFIIALLMLLLGAMWSVRKWQNMP
ncbi:MAG: hypothetical protein HN341_16935 [Verrucomicrobia bacterium]|nr:hypothetical protein [Verrucomicrobiota bacterium]